MDAQKFLVVSSGGLSMRPTALHTAVVTLVGGLMGWVLGGLFSRTPIPDGDVPLGLGAHIAVGLGGVVAALLYVRYGRWRSSLPTSPLITVCVEPMIFGLIAAIVAGMSWALPNSLVISFIGVPVALLMLFMPLPLILISIPCAWVCRMVFTLLQKT